MKKFLLLVVMVVMGVAAMAQSTNKISYQAVIRDGQNRLAVDANITVKVTIGSYVETFNATTNSNGLVSLQIPNTNVSAFESIDWSTASITTEVTVGSDVMTNTVPVTAVPFALYSSDVNPTGSTMVAIYDKIKTDSIALHDALIDSTLDLRTSINSIANNLAMEHVLKVSATDGQTSFTLASEPSASYLVKMFINGVMVGDNSGSDAVITVSGTTATYNPANNGDYALKAGDRIAIYYFY